MRYAPWTSEAAFWAAAHRLLLDLRRLRLRASAAASATAAERIRRFCQRLRGSPHLILARLQRAHHLPDAVVVLVIHVAALSCGAQPTSNSLGDGLLLACGFYPPRQIAMMDMIRAGRGHGRLFVIRSGHIYPSPTLVTGLRGGTWPDWQVAEYKKAVAELPEKGPAAAVRDNPPSCMGRSRRARAARRATPR